ncbi:hypothetical protein P3W85_30295 [Cupriavidus basilensis]|uniref:DUF6630 domain-containing protein n=1 Tax=Cupriavidus basilensis TaxID=68895 RepID=A0ABT6AX50_9BURK|nr:hypothetical protein [Cupriavidus basilensis]MDF3837214.1 hypothetical protein [Cupriavidus basilensis]
MTIVLTSETQDALRKLILLISLHDQDAAERYWTLFQQALARAEPGCDGHLLLWPLSEALGQGGGFYVDWKDTAALVRGVQALCDRVDLRIDWGVGDPLAPAFLARRDVPALMTVAQASLRAAGYTLWCWDTQADAYAGWMIRSRDEDMLAELAGRLHLMIDPADETY